MPQNLHRSILALGRFLASMTGDCAQMTWIIHTVYEVGYSRGEGGLRWTSGTPCGRAAWRRRELGRLRAARRYTHRLTHTLLHLFTRTMLGGCLAQSEGAPRASSAQARRHVLEVSRAGACRRATSLMPPCSYAWGQSASLPGARLPALVTEQQFAAGQPTRAVQPVLVYRINVRHCESKRPMKGPGPLASGAGGGGVRRV